VADADNATLLNKAASYGINVSENIDDDYRYEILLPLRQHG